MRIYAKGKRMHKKDFQSKSISKTCGRKSIYESIEMPKTDLAIETHEFNVEKGKDDGINVETYMLKGIEITKVTIFKGRGEEISGKKAGLYITADIGEFHLKPIDEFEKIAICLSTLIGELIPQGDGCVLVAGVGNEEIISDAIGPKTASGVIATRHIKMLKEDLYKSLKLSETVSIQTGVMGNTGIESAEIVSSIVEKIKPKCVIAIDSLASRRLSRLATTVQISNAGISPGAGVANRRLELTYDILGVPVIAMGIPTVVDAFTLVWDLTEGEECRELCKEKNNFYVAPKESDSIIKSASKLLSTSINMALHGLSLSELADLQ